MRKWRTAVLMVVLILFVSGFVFADDYDFATKKLGELSTITTTASSDKLLVYDDSARAGTVMDANSPTFGGTVTAGAVSVTGTIDPGAVNNPVDLHNTTDNTLITAAETGTTFICTQNTKFQLPAAAEGLTYTFVTVGSAEVEIQVNTTPDTIKLVSAGDGDGSQGVVETGINTTGNTLTLISDGTDWYAMTKYTSEAAWVDGGAWTEITDFGAQA